MEFVSFKGSPEEIGFQHGELLQRKIDKTREFYSRVLFGNRQALIEDYGERYLEAIRSFCTEYAVEIEAVAKGSGRFSWQIAALNARTELFHLVNARAGAGECTALYFPGSRILGQNWDWMEQMEPLIVIMQIEREDGHRILQLTEPGIIGKIGLNSKGIGVCLNIITGGGAPVAEPVHILLRYVLDSGNLDHVLNRFRHLNHGTYSNILMADDFGRWANLELAGTKMELVHYGNEIPLHTNHYLSDLKDNRDNSKDILYPNSRARYSRGRDLLSRLKGDEGIDAFKSVLMDAEETNPICAKYINLRGLKIGTVSSVIMDLPGRILYATSGRPDQDFYRMFNLPE